MIRFTVYRRDMDQRETHNEQQKNPESEPQYEGVIFTDGTVVLRWLTPLRSHSVWPDFQTAMGVHGHPEYGAEIFFHDDSKGYAQWWDHYCAKIAASLTANQAQQTEGNT